MKGVLVVARRELAQTFRSPLAYVFLVLFLVLAQLPHVLAVLPGGQAHLRLFFEAAPWFVAVFAALATMRAWAEERQEGTYEMLLTFPIRDGELVLGKFLAAWTFLLVAVALTASLPAMLFAIGDPDPGPIAAGYLGVALHAALSCALGLVCSALTRSQLLAALIAFVAGFLNLVLGMSSVMVLVDAKVPGLGVALQSLIGVWPHFDPFTRGVLELADVAWFAVWVGALLWLNAFLLGQGREPSRRPTQRFGARAVTAVGSLLVLGCGLLASRCLHETSLARADLTQERLFTISPGTLTVMERATSPVRATLYISPRDEMPAAMQGLERQVLDRLAEVRVASGGKLVVNVLHPSARDMAAARAEEAARRQAGPAGRRERTLEERLGDKGVLPFQVQSQGATDVTVRSIYASLGLTYEDQGEQFVHGLQPGWLPRLEYEVASAVSRLVRRRAPRVALFAGREPLSEREQAMLEASGQPVPEPYTFVKAVLERERYDVRTTTLDAYEPMPQDCDVVVIVGPVEWNERQQWELNRALVSGRPVLLAAQRYTWMFRPVPGRQPQPIPRVTDPGVDRVLEAQGITLSRDLLMDVQASVHRQGTVRAQAPMNVNVVADGLDRSSVITGPLSRVSYLWGTALELDRTAISSRLAEVKVLARSSDRSWEVASDRPLTTADLVSEGAPSPDRARPLVALVDGPFVDAFAGEERPAWPYAPRVDASGRAVLPPHDAPSPPVTPRPGRLLVTGCARMFDNTQLSLFGDNVGFLVNAVGALTADAALQQVRAKEPRSRQFAPPTRAVARLWTVITLVLVPLLVVAAGAGIGAARLRGRRRWDAEHGR